VTYVTVRGFTLKNNAAGTGKTTELNVFSDNQSYLTEGLHIIEDCHFDGQNQVYDSRVPILIHGTCINTVFRRNVFRDLRINEDSTANFGVVFVATKPVATVVGEPQVTLADNKFYGNNGLVFECVGDSENKRYYRLVFERNTLTANTSALHGVVVIVDNPLSNIVWNNIFLDNSSSSTAHSTLHIYNASNTRIYHNTFKNHTWREVLVDRGCTAGVEIKNNIFWPTPGSYCIDVRPGCTENLISANNAFFADWNEDGYPPGSGFSTTENTEAVGLWNGFAMTTHSWNNESKKNTGNGYTLGGPGLDKNMHLVAGSLCIDRGVSGLVSDDIDGGQRPVGAGYDSGADEYGTTGPARSLGGEQGLQIEGQQIVPGAPIPTQQQPSNLPERVASTASQAGRTSAEKPPAAEPNRPIASAPKAGDVMTNSVGMKLVWVPAGEFMMGSPMSEAQRHSTEGPQHRVRISKGFWMGAYEVTQQEYLAVTGNNPSIFDLPVESVSWEDAQGFCRRLSQKDGRTYRLPTEAEWEYACRGGTTGPYAGDLEAMAWHRENSGDRTHRVGQKRPNAFGLYDMHGNVFEWCQDWDGDYASNPEVDPQGPAGGTDRVLRGGSWGTDRRLCRSAGRVSCTPDGRSSDVGFRVVCVSAPK
jgi:formylglycine-generating enzyme required for sulfatase activity